MIEVDQLSPLVCKLGEGPLFLEKLFYWIDIEGRQVHRLQTRTDELHSFVTPSRPGCVVPRQSGGVVVALEDGIYALNEQAGRVERLAYIHLTDQRLNDGKCDRAGRLWVGAMGLRGQKEQSRLYRVDPDHSVHVMLEGVTISNGLAWTQDDKTLYYIDTPTGRIDAFDFDLAAGTISNRRTAVTVDPSLGHPDGMTIDTQGRLWVGLWGGSSVACFDPASGKLLSKIALPVTNVTCPTFGSALLDHLYITTAQFSENEPDAGKTFVCTPGTTGFAPFAFGG